MVSSVSVTVRAEPALVLRAIEL
jgi:hypothetical protein